jgi:hypothetical protein
MRDTANQRPILAAAADGTATAVVPRPRRTPPGTKS